MNPLADLVRQVVRAPATAVVDEEKINTDVFRIGCAVEGVMHSFVGKRLDPDIARRNELVARRWLPAVGLGDSGPPLLATAAERDGSFVWHLYEDLGDTALDAPDVDDERLALAVATIARIHTRFERHPLTAEIRNWGGDLGFHFYATSVRDAITALEWVLSRRGRLGAERASLCSRLLARVNVLRDEQDRRAEALARDGGPETLLHGDLWPMNVMVNAHAAGVRLIDWDHAAIGPVSYDLSTFLGRFPEDARAAVLGLYEGELRRAGWTLSEPGKLNALFETAELARIANRVIWPALAAGEHNAGWAYEELAEVERWFEELTPVIPAEACAQS